MSPEPPEPRNPEAFLTQRINQGMEGATVKSFQVPQSVLTDLQSSAVPESMARHFPNNPIVVDVTKAPNQFGLRGTQIDELQKSLIQGTGRIGIEE